MCQSRDELHVHRVHIRKFSEQQLQLYLSACVLPYQVSTLEVRMLSLSQRVMVQSSFPQQPDKIELLLGFFFTLAAVFKVQLSVVTCSPVNL